MSVDDRWRELAELLGLPPEGAGPPTLQAPPPETKQSPPEAAGAAGEKEEMHRAPEVVEPERSHPVSKPENDEGEKPSGRRRGRRGRKRRDEEGPSPMEGPETQGDHEVAAEARKGDDQEGGPRRGRRRRKPPEEAAGPEGGMETARREDDPAEDESGGFAHWNLPSWEELIASLKRPDR